MAHFSMHLNPFLFPCSVGVIFVALLFVCSRRRGLSFTLWTNDTNPGAFRCSLPRPCRTVMWGQAHSNKTLISPV